MFNFPFLITLQQKKIKARAAELNKRKQGLQVKPVNGVKAAAQEVNNACQYFKEKTKSPSERIKSFIPGTKVFRLRLICAERIQRLKCLLDEVEIAIANGKPKLPSPSYVNGSKAIKKSYSDTDPIIYKSPISQLPLKTRDDLMLRTKRTGNIICVYDDEPRIRLQ